MIAKLSYSRSVLFVHETCEKVEDLIEASWCVDPMQTLLSSWRCILSQNCHLFDECWVELKKMLHCDTAQVNYSYLASNHKVVVFVEHVVEHHSRYTHGVLDRELLWVENARPDQYYTR